MTRSIAEQIEYAWDCVEQASINRDIEALRRSTFYLLKLRSIAQDREIEKLPIIR